MKIKLWFAVVFALTLATLLIVIAAPTSTDKPSSKVKALPANVLTVALTCEPPMDYFGIQLGYHIKVVIQGDIDTSPVGVWTLIREPASRKSVLISYQGPTSIYTGAVLHGFANSIRDEGLLWIEPGKNYNIEVWRGEYTEGMPNLEQMIAQKSFRLDTCPLLIFLPAVAK